MLVSFPMIEEAPSRIGWKRDVNKIWRLNPHLSLGQMRSIPLPKQENLFTSSLLCSVLLLDLSIRHWFIHAVPLTMKSRLLNNIIGLILVFWLQKRMLPPPVSCLSSYWLWWGKRFIWCSLEVTYQDPLSREFCILSVGHLTRFFINTVGDLCPLYFWLPSQCYWVWKAFLSPGKGHKKG